MSDEQWIRTRYCVLVSFKRHELLDLFMRRHEVACALVHRDLTAASTIDNRSSAWPGSAASRTGILSATTPTGPETPRTTGPSQPSFRPASGEPWPSWLLRLSKTLPKLKRGADRRLTRIPFEPGMKFSQYAAAVGIQLLQSVPSHVLENVEASDSLDALAPIRTTLLLETVLAIEAHSCCPLLRNRPADTDDIDRDSIDHLVHSVSVDRGIDFSHDPNGHLERSKAATRIYRELVKVKNRLDEEDLRQQDSTASGPVSDS